MVRGGGTMLKRGGLTSSVLCPPSTPQMKTLKVERLISYLLIAGRQHTLTLDMPQ